jgi:pilus assembly protein CpaB
MLRRHWPVASKILMVLAVLLGSLAFVLVRGYQDRVEALRPAVGPMVPVVLAAADLARGSVLTETMLEPSSMPESFVPPGAVASPAAAAGRVLTANIAAGEVLTSSRLSVPEAGPIAALVPEGLRAMVITAPLPASALRPGDHIDVYATYGGGRPHTELAASALEVLRIIAGSSGGGGIAGTTSSTDGITLFLLVDEAAAERLAYARSFAQLSVAILGPEPATGTP